MLWLQQLFQRIGLQDIAEFCILIVSVLLYQLLAIDTFPWLNLVLAITAVCYVANTLFISGRVQFFIKRMMIIFVVLLMIIIPVFVQIYRWHFNPSQARTYHDGALQTEIAYMLFRDGKNPYAENYYTTKLGQDIVYRYFSGTKILNPALEHYIYLPGTFLFGGAARHVEQIAFGFSDERFLYLICFLICAWVVYDLVKNSKFGFSIFLLFALNPWTSHFLVQGRNDALPLCFFMGALWCITKKYYIASGIFLGLAFATKQFTWLFVPFLIAYFFATHGLHAWKTKQFVSLFLPALVITCLLLIPFLLWDVHDFIDDTILYASGSSSGLNYPIAGFGFFTVLLLFNFNPFGSFPFWVFMALVACCMAYFGIRSILRYKKLSITVLWYGIFMLATFFFARFFNSNHLMYIYDVLLIGTALYLYENKKLSVTQQ